MCCTGTYLILVLVDKYVESYHNNVTHIPSLVMHAVVVYKHTLWPCPDHMMFDNYYAYVASHSSNMSQRYDYKFHQTSCSVHFGFGI